MLFGRALVAAYEGDEEVARRLVARGLEIAATTGDGWFGTQHRSVLGFLELSLDRPSQAMQHLAQVDEHLQGMAVEEPGCFTHRNDLLEALIGAGRFEEAERRLEEMNALARRIDRPRLLCHARRAEAMLASRGGEYETAVTLLEEALEMHDASPSHSSEAGRCSRSA